MNETLAIKGAPRTAPPGRRPQLDIRVERRGGRSFVASQFVTYPFHLTRAFHLDVGLPEVATLYTQSSSGGLYPGEDLSIRIAVGEGAALHLTTQASTIVHGHEARQARTSIRLDVASGGFLAFTPDPQILFPGASSHTEITAHLGKDAALILSDGFLLHDPTGAGRPPAHYSSTMTVCDDRGVPVFTDRQRVAGAALVDPAGPLAGFRVAGSAVAFGLKGDAAAAADWDQRFSCLDVLAGTTPLAAGWGLGARILAQGGTAFQDAAWQAFSAGFKTRFSVAPAPRRK